MRRPDSAEKTVWDIRSSTRRHRPAEKKFRIVLGSLRAALAVVAFSLNMGLSVADTTGAGPVRIVSLELVLAVDVSASVDDSEYRLQIHGVANAFRHPEIIGAIMQHRHGVAVTLVQWGGWAESIPNPPWRLLSGRKSILNFADEIETIRRKHVGHLTAIGNAIDFSVELIETNEFHGHRRKIDVSGDGQNNSGLPAAQARQRALLKGITINGLAILTDEPWLFDYYEKQVVGGPAAFVLQADSYDDFSEAMARKLLRELTIQLASALVQSLSGPARPDRTSGTRTTRGGAF